MLGAILILLILGGGAYAVTQVGGIITLRVHRRRPVPRVQAPAAAHVHGDVHRAAGRVHIFGAASAPAGIWKGFLWLLLGMLWLLNVRPLRKAIITRPFMKAYLKLLPSMSQTEKEALEAGTVWWDGELFTGKPKWSKLLIREAAAALRRGAGVHRRPVRRAVPHARRLGHHSQARRHAAAGVGLPQVAEASSR